MEDAKGRELILEGHFITSVYTSFMYFVNLPTVKLFYIQNPADEICLLQ